MAKTKPEAAPEKTADSGAPPVDRRAPMPKTDESEKRLKSWVRAEIRLAASGVSEDERKDLNP